MTLKELKEELNKLGVEYDNSIVISQKDAEGNGYSPVRGAEPAIYVADNNYSGEVFDEDEDLGIKGEPCIVIYPIN